MTQTTHRIRKRDECMRRPATTEVEMVDRMEDAQWLRHANLHGEVFIRDRQPVRAIIPMQIHQIH